MLTEEQSTPTEFPTLLNRLDEMQRAPYYATARDTLAQAEQVIVQLESELRALRLRPSAAPALVEAIYALHHAAYSHGVEAGKAGPHVDAANIASQAALNAALAAALGKAAPAAQAEVTEAAQCRTDAKKARPPSDAEPWVVADDYGLRVTFRDEDAAWRYRNENTDRLTNPTVTHEPATTAPASAAQAAPAAPIEAAAKAIYELFDGAERHPWVKGGNSLKQGDARRFASAALHAAAPAATQEQVLDAERLDWLDKHGTSRIYRVRVDVRPVARWRWSRPGEEDAHFTSIREAIDAARAAQKAPQ